MSAAEELGSPETRAFFWLLFGLIALGVVGLSAYMVLARPPTPPPPEIARDSLLVQGREVYLSRCLSCHGASGRGDGPLSKTLQGPPVGDLTDADWKHGDTPERVMSTLAIGVRDTSMPGWKGTLSESDLSAVAAYVYHLAGRNVPASLRAANRASP